MVLEAQVPLEVEVLKVSLVFQDLQEKLAKDQKERRDSQGHLDFQVQRVFQVCLEIQEHQDKPVYQAYQEVQAPKETLGSQGNPDLQDDQDQREEWEKWAFQVHQVSKALRGTRGFQASLAPLGSLASKVTRASPADQSLDLQAFPDRRENQDLLVFQEALEAKDLQVPPDFLDYPVHLV